MIRAGLLTEHISLYELTINKSDYGQTTNTYKLYYQTNARVVYDKGDRQVTNNEQWHGVTVTFTVRYYVPVAYTDQIHYDNEIYRIISIDRDKSQNQIQIIAERVNE